MIDFSVFSIWGIVLACLSLGAIIVLYNKLDQRLMLRMLRVFLYFFLSVVVVALYMWGLQVVDHWWAHVLWILIVAVLTSSLLLKKNHLWRNSFLLPVNLGVITGMTFAVGTSLLIFPVHTSLFLPAVVAVEAALVLTPVSTAVNTYLHSLRHTQEHFQYLLANGASRYEAILPSARRAFRAYLLPILRSLTAPVVVAPPMLLCGMLMLGYAPFQAVALLLLLTVVLLTSGLLTTTIILYLLNRVLFDRSGKLLL